MNKFLGFLVIGVFSIAAITAFTFKNDVRVNDGSIEIPEEVNTVLNTYCFGCHNTESRNEKGKGKLSIDSMGELPAGKLAATLNKMASEIEEGEMPPAKFLEKNPDKAPSDKDKKLVIKWAKKAAKEL